MKSNICPKFINPLYACTGIIGYSNEILIEKPCCIIARVGANCGYVQYSNTPCWVSDNAIIAVPNSGVNVKYLYYLLSSKEINNFRIGSTQPLITSSILNSIDFVRHTHEEQQHIVNTISLL